MRTTRAGFTLIELLVVIAIIAILAAILFPVFARAKERGNQAQCLGNMTQLWKAFRMYVDDWEGRMPVVRVHSSDPTQNWCGSYGFGGCPLPAISKGQLWLYVKNKGVYLCKSDQGVVAEWFKDAAGKPVRNYPTSYSVNRTLCGSKIDLIPPPMARSGVMMLHESRQTVNDGDFNIDCDIVSKVHFDGTTVTYLDGHSRWRTTKELEAQKSKWAFPDNLMLPCH